MTTLSEMPSAIFAGDTLLVSLLLASYPASEWTCSFSFRFSTGSQIDFTATADNSKHLINVAPATTADWVAGTYAGFGRVTNIADATKVVTFWTGELVVKANFASASADFDSRSWAKKCLDAIEAVLQGKAGRDILNSTIAGQSIGRMSPMQLFEMRDRFKAEYQAEQAAEAAGQGKPQQSNIAITFINP